MSEPSSAPLPCFPPPWVCHADFYSIPFYTTASTLPLLTPGFLHAPLEASHESAGHALSTPVGGIGMLQIIRYKDTPVGPYDEMVVIPGSYECVKVEGGREVERRGLRITRIYVSQKETCYNGRKNWNIPKHLADFTFTTNPDSSLTITIQPHHSPTTTPFFKTTFHPSSPLLPPIPLSLTLLSPLISTTCILPPLPSSTSTADREEAEYLVGTERWAAFTPRVRSWKTKVGWFDMRQGKGGEEEEERKNFWPGWGRWRIGFWMKDAVLQFDEPDTWASADAREVKKRR